MQQRLQEKISYFRAKIDQFQLNDRFVDSGSAIQSCVIGGNTFTKNCASILTENGFDVKPILAPTVPEGLERLRFCLHVYNSEEEIERVLQILKETLDK